MAEYRDCMESRNGFKEESESWSRHRFVSVPSRTRRQRGRTSGARSNTQRVSGNPCALRGRELHFEPNPATGRVVIQVRDLDGRVLRTVTPSEALSIASGTAL